MLARVYKLSLLIDATTESTILTEHRGCAQIEENQTGTSEVVRTDLQRDEQRD